MASPSSLLAQVPKLTSLATAKATIYLDFDGESVTSGFWNSGATLNCSPALLTNTQIEEIYNRVSEDFRPFNVRVTTDLDTFKVTSLNRRVRIIITPTSSWREAGIGGIAYTGSFTWSDDTPAFVFSDRLGHNSKYVAECVTHESGHTLGLSHQTKYDATCRLLETYSTGNGSGAVETSWAPVMGNSYYKNMTGWNNGPTPSGCAAVQDNLSIITSQNGFTYRVDDYTDATNNTATLLGTSFNKEGVITTATDRDAFKYTVSQTANFHMDATPFSVGINSAGANLDIQIQLFNGTSLVRTYNPTDKMRVTIDTVLNAGSYYLLVSGVGNEYGTDYGSLGAYTITGFQGALPIHDITLSGTVDKSTHNLSWNIIADEPIKTQVLEMSTDAINFVPVGSISTLFNRYAYNTNQNTTIFYRLKVTSVIEQTAYSNIVALKATAGSGKRFTVSTFVQSDLTVNSTDNYQYRLTDANGRMLAAGIGQKGLNRINLSNQPGGLYILQLISNNERQTERIIKQ